MLSIGGMYGSVREANRGDNVAEWTWDSLDEDERQEQFDLGAASRFFGEDFFGEVWCWDCDEIVWLSEALECAYDDGHDVQYRSVPDRYEDVR